MKLVLILRQQSVLLVPKFLGKIHIIAVRIFKTGNLFPKCTNLCKAICTDRAERTGLIEAFAVLKELGAQTNRTEILHGLTLPGMVGVKNRVRLCALKEKNANTSQVMIIQTDHGEFMT